MNTDGKTKVCGVIANPVAHSMSPLLQNLYAKQTGVNLTYVPFKVEEQNLEAAVKGAFSLNILGMNVTVPHKQAVMEYLSDIDETAQAIGAVNTLVRTECGYKGYNTDVPGLLRTVREFGISLKDRACILIGAGGAAKAAAYMMAKEGASVIYVLNRNLQRAENLASYINGLFSRELVYPLALEAYAQIPDGKYIAIQTTSVGMYPDVDAAPIEDSTFYQKISEAVDVIYTPAETRFMKKVVEAGGRVRNGLDMLLYQGVIAYELWNPGVRVDEETVVKARELVLDKLRKDKKDAENQKSDNSVPSRQRVKNLILIGFMGAGKTSVGQYYAKKHNLPFVDIDSLIEITAGMSVSDLFAKKGEAEFRRRETEVLKRLLDTETVVPQKTLISVGGGLPLKEENRQLLKQLGTVVFLKVSPETVVERLKGDTKRPLLQGDDVNLRVAKLLAERESIYIEAAHEVVEADGRDFDEIVEEIEAIVKAGN